MPGDTEQLVVSLEARINQFEKNFQKAQRTANDNFSSIERRGQQSAEKLERTFGDVGKSVSGKIEGIFKPFLAGGVIAAGATAAATALSEVAKTVAEVDREARKAGVSAKTWQQWAYVATATGANIDGVTDALKELNIRSDEFAKTGKGSAQEAFQRLGFSVSDVAERIKDPSRFLDEIIGKLKSMDAAAQTRNLDELFGGQGAEEMAKVLGLSVAEIQKMRQEAATFSDEQIESAKKIDAEFATLWRNVSVYAKQALINGVGYAEGLIDAISTLKGDKLIERYKADAADPAKQLERLQQRRASVVREMDDVRSNPFSVLKEAELRNLQSTFDAIDEQIADLSGGSDELKSALSELSNITQNAGQSFNNTAASAANFQSALAEIKKLVPGLKSDLDSLATSSNIDAAYQRAVASARTMGEVMNATDLANRAKTAARYGTQSNMLDLIGAVESGAGGYNATLDNGRWTGGAQNLTAMTLDQVRALQRQMLANPQNRALYGDGQGSSALGKYMITGRTLDSLISELGLTEDRLFDEGTQDELARALLRRRGSDPASLRQEWIGLRNVDDSTIRNAYSNTPTGATKLDPTPGQQKAIDLARQQDDARKSLNRTVQEGLDLAKFEQSISGMSAQQKQVELEVYRTVQEAKRAGITLSDQELQKIREQITATQQLNATNKQAQTSTEGMQQAQQFFAQNFTSALSGLLTGTTTLEGAMQQLANSIINAALQAALLGQGPLAGLSGDSSGGGLGGLFGMLFSAKGGLATRSRMTMLRLAGGGGVRGPGTATSDSIPAMLSDGEFVVNAGATRRNRAALEAINAGRVASLGASVGRGGAMAAPINQVSSYFAPTIPITVQASGNEQTDKKMQQRLSAEMNTLLENKMAEFVQKQQRPGNMLNSRGFV
ncbi:hypothetical protein GFL54_18950 [Rhizobium laguerreae]|uniref:phage tail tape measure protein n=1 Tax=Rhizobium laguerreae TaxID=1076926 RepID=UPI00143F3115|nr:phage tail tape measure protein [Rhizobium laguerreae]NKM86341.1 hypothetical protein [Rhizobium laguerreae]